MRLTRIELRNFKPYGEADVDLDRGVTVIHGPNGSGKSSLLEACFFALYGSQSLDGTLEDVITNGEDETEIAVHFRHAGGEYRIERRVRLSNDRAQTARCVLDTPDGTVEGARDVRDAVANLLRMDAEAFVNCAYVRQGEVNKLINATPRARQDMLDDLLQLGMLEEYRERAGEARLGVDDLLENRRGNLDGIEQQIAEKEDKDLHARLNALESDLKEVDAEIERFETNRKQAEETLDETAAILEEHDARKEELDSLATDIEELRTAISETEAEREELSERIADHREDIETLCEERDELLAATELDAAEPTAVATRIDDLEADAETHRDRIQELRLTVSELTAEADTLEERANELETTAAEHREDAAELEDELDDAEATLAERREKLDELDDRVAKERDRFDDTPADFGDAAAYVDRIETERDELRERIGDVRAELETKRSEIEQAENLLAEGRCPECGQPVEESPHVDSLDDDREQVAELETELADLEGDLESVEETLEQAERLLEAERTVEQLEENRATVEQLLAEQEATIEDKRERIDDLRQAAADAESEAEENREKAADARADAEEQRDAIDELNEEQQTLRDSIERLESLESTLSNIEDVEAEIERLRERRDLLDERNQDRRGTLDEKRERRRELQAEFDDARVEWAREEHDRAVNYLEQVETKLDELHEERDRLQGQIGGVETELDELDRLRERRDELTTRVEALESLHEEATEVEELYADLRAELRQQNLTSLERLLNETFDLVYQNDAYARIELDEQYELTVYQKDGEPLDPAQLSGGERALFNLSLRCAIYRLLAEGIDGTAPMPPLILDEPTVFLDAGHVSRLITLVESMRELGVEQIVVVSHDDELVGAADTVVTVSKDPTTNRSSVDSRSAVLDAPAD